MAESEIALLQQYARTQDAFAFRKLVEQHQDMVFAACHRVLGNRADAEDAAQNCFLKLAQAAGRLKAPIGGWLYTVAVHGAIDMLRGENARHARERAVALSASQTRTSEAPWSDVRGEVDAAIMALPERLRTPIVLYFLEARTQADVAAELGITAPSVSRRLTRGVAALRRRLKRAGIMTSIVALPTMLASGTAEAAPATLVANLGKVALLGTGGAKAATVGTSAVLKISAVLALGAAIGAGAVLVHQATRPPRPTPLAAAATGAAAAPAPPVKKAQLTPEAVLDMELTLPAGGIRLGDLGMLLKNQINVYFGCHARESVRYVYPKPGKHKVRDILAAITASAPLTAEVLTDRDRLVVCVWRKPDAQMLPRMMKLARSDDVLERCTGARWLEAVGGREALVQLLKMLGDPDPRVRHFAAWAVKSGWASTRQGLPPSAIPCVAPDGTTRAVAKAIESETWRETRQNMLRIARCLRSPELLPVLKKLLAKVDKEKPDGDFRSTVLICQTIAEVGGPKAEAILLAAADRLPKASQPVMGCLGMLGTDGAIVRLSKRLDDEIKKDKLGRTYTVAGWLGASDNPGAARELIRILNLPGRHREFVAPEIVQMLAKFDTPEAQGVCLAKFKAETDPRQRAKLARTMVRNPAVRKMLFAELAQGGAVGHRAACALATTNDPRLVPMFDEILNADAKTLNAEGVGTGNRYTAIAALERIGSPEAEQILIKLAQGTMRSGALRSLGAFSSHKARKVLRDALQAPNLYSSVAAGTMARRPDPADLDPLLAAIRGNDPDKPRDMTDFWRAVAAIGGERATGALLGATVKGDAMAARVLVYSPDAYCIQAVRNVLVGVNAAQRRLMMAGFGRRSKVEYNARLVRVPPLTAFYAANVALAELPDADEQTKQQHAALLGWTHDPRGTDALAKLLVNAREPVAVRLAALMGLAYAGGASVDPAAVEPVRHAYEHDKDKNVQRHAKNALMRWRVIPMERPERPRPPKDPDPKDPPDEREFPPPPDP